MEGEHGDSAGPQQPSLDISISATEPPPPRGQGGGVGDPAAWGRGQHPPLRAAGALGAAPSQALPDSVAFGPGASGYAGRGCLHRPPSKSIMPVCQAQL